ncbi:MAG: dienelactone hydrolase family protein [Methanomicrobiales archaeon]|nr:dienelactone hydrolase family protein [Methanomicrobiales archaeon]
MKRIMLCVVLSAVVLLAGCVETGDGGNGGVQQGTTVAIESGGQSYPAYLASPGAEGSFPAVILMHSFNGLEPGYRDLADRFSGEGYVVIEPEWQTFEQRPGDDVVEQLIRDSITYLGTVSKADPERLGLTGFCAGGRYTMLLLPQIEEFRSGVAWYGFPYSGGFNNETTPAEHIGDLADPILIIHGSRDQPSPVAGIYQYATDLDAAGRYFELKVYQGEPHGFMIENGELSESFAARDAYREMVSFFDRTLVKQP